MLRSHLFPNWIKHLLQILPSCEMFVLSFSLSQKKTALLSAVNIRGEGGGSRGFTRENMKHSCIPVRCRVRSYPIAFIPEYPGSTEYREFSPVIAAVCWRFVMLVEESFLDTDHPPGHDVFQILPGQWPGSAAAISRSCLFEAQAQVREGSPA